MGFMTEGIKVHATVKGWTVEGRERKKPPAPSQGSTDNPFDVTSIPSNKECGNNLKHCSTLCLRFHFALLGFPPLPLARLAAGSYDTLSFHGVRRGAQPLMVIPPANAPANAAPAVPQKYVNFTYGGFKVPANETSYVCKVGGRITMGR